MPTANIPVILQKIAKWDGIDLENIPQKSTVELMTRELGAIAELQAAETIMANNTVTVGFDALTQEGTYVNEIHFTTEKDCVSAAVDELAGGTSEDYCNHICQTEFSIFKCDIHAGLYHSNIELFILITVMQTLLLFTFASLQDYFF